MKQEHKNLTVCKLTPEQHERTCGYWYVVTSGAMPHTAFATRAGLNRYMRERGLELAKSLSDVRDEHDVSPINGFYRTESHLYDSDSFESIPGERTRTMSNGDYVVGILEHGADGVVTVHTLNPNVRTRKVFDYRESNAMIS